MNWPTAADPYWAADFPIRVQWCHGAPGIVTSLATLRADDETDELLGQRASSSGSGPAPQGRGALSRHGRQRLRVPRAPRPHGRRALARPCTSVRDARARAGRGLRADATRSGPATSALRSTCGHASTAGRACRCSTFSRSALVVLPDDEPKPEVELVELEQVAVPLGPGAAREIGRPSCSIARSTCAAVELMEEADPGAHSGIEVSVGPPPEREPEPVDAVVRDGHRLGSSPSSRPRARRGPGARSGLERPVLGEVVPREPELEPRGEVERERDDPLARDPLHLCEPERPVRPVVVGDHRHRRVDAVVGERNRPRPRPGSPVPRRPRVARS